MMSAKLTPPACTRTSSSPGPAAGSWTCRTFSHSGPPKRLMTRAFIGSSVPAQPARARLPGAPKGPPPAAVPRSLVFTAGVYFPFVIFLFFFVLWGGGWGGGFFFFFFFLFTNHSLPIFFFSR